MGLTAATYLGDNTIPILDALVGDLVEAGIDISIDPAAGRDSVDARAHASGVDLAWMCGYLATVLLDDGVLPHEVVAAPVFGGETSAVYRSVFVSRRGGAATVAEALSGAIAVNEVESWSGNHGLRRHLGSRWFATEIVTGTHRSSVAAVAGGQCDVAGIDATVWEHLVSTDPDLVTGLRVIDATGDWPAPPFLVHPRATADLRAHLREGMTAPGLVTTVPAQAVDYHPLRP